MKKLGITLITIVLGGLILLQTPAMAAVSDPAIYNALKNRRITLVSKESDLLRSRDSILRQSDDLNRRNENNQFSSRLDQLKRDLDINTFDLQRVRLDIRDIDIALS